MHPLIPKLTNSVQIYEENFLNTRLGDKELFAEMKMQVSHGATILSITLSREDLLLDIFKNTSCGKSRNQIDFVLKGWKVRWPTAINSGIGLFR